MKGGREGMRRGGTRLDPHQLFLDRPLAALHVIIAGRLYRSNRPKYNFSSQLLAHNTCNNEEHPTTEQRYIIRPCIGRHINNR